MLLCGACDAAAQIRIVPRQRLDSIARPTTVGEGRVHFEHGGELNFGSIDESAPRWSQRIRWSNISDTPIVVTRVTTSCSCVTVEYDRNKVEPNGEGWLTISFNPKGRVGKVTQRVAVYTNLSDVHPTAVLHLRGYVETSEGDIYTSAMGALRLTTKRVAVERGKPFRVTLACKNAADKPLHIEADRYMPSTGVTLRTEPEVLNGGAEGVLIIEGAGVEKPVRLYVGGIDVAPSQRVIDIMVDHKD